MIRLLEKHGRAFQGRTPKKSSFSKMQGLFTWKSAKKRDSTLSSTTTNKEKPEVTRSCDYSRSDFDSPKPGSNR